MWISYLQCLSRHSVLHRERSLILGIHCSPCLGPHCGHAIYPFLLTTCDFWIFQKYTSDDTRRANNCHTYIHRLHKSSQLPFPRTHSAYEFLGHPKCSTLVSARGNHRCTVHPVQQPQAGHAETTLPHSRLVTSLPVMSNKCSEHVAAGNPTVLNHSLCLQ